MAGRPPIPLEKRFWEKVDKRGPDDCWPWLGSSYGEGYGGIMIAGVGCIGAHRVAYSLTHSVAPERLFVLHSCDNRRCCNPAHLFLGTHQDNMDDMVSKGRGRNGVVVDTTITCRYQRLYVGKCAYCHAKLPGPCRNPFRVTREALQAPPRSPDD